MSLYCKKPVVIEAVQWTGCNVDEVLALTLTSCSVSRKDCAGPHGGIMPGGALVIPTLEGDHTASPGDWIVRGAKNECYPVKPEIFEATYEAA